MIGPTDLRELFDRAVSLPATDRPAFLDQACGQNHALRTEVERLLAAHDRLGSLLDTLPGQDTPDLSRRASDRPRLGLAAGVHLGPYEITEPLGAGGMGEVYRARDPRLGRDIAIKVLPPHLGDDHERQERFEREARAVAALNHPHIVTLYSVEEESGTRFLTMEFVEGKTLAEIIPKHGLPLARLLDVAIPMSDAIGTAHQKGITHRDLKPLNVMVRDDGCVKVLDFGLAKLAQQAPEAGGFSQIPTQLLTDEWRIVGTTAYMSPEQAEGKPVDYRTDIFSLGVILYEMATGQRPFKGDTSVSILSSIVKDTPVSVTTLNPGVPRALAQIIARMLSKDPERRYQSAKDVRNELEDLRQELQSGELRAGSISKPVRSFWATRAGLLVGATIIIAAALMVIIFRMITTVRNEPESGPVIINIARITVQQGIESFPSLSPDAKWVVYASGGDIFLQNVGGQAAINLTNDRSAENSQPAFSPDGEHIAFLSQREGGGIFVMGQTGESVRRVGGVGFNPKWSPDGKELVFATEVVQAEPESRTSASQLWAINVATGAKRLVCDTDAVQPSWSPHGFRIAYWSSRVTGRPLGQRDIWTVPAAGGQATPVTDDPALDWSPIWSPDGRFLYFSSDRGGSMNLWRIAIDERSGKALARPEPVTTPALFLGHFSFSGDGTRLAFESRAIDQNVLRAEFDPKQERIGGEPARVTTGSRRWAEIDVSPDGQWLTMRPIGMQEDIFVVRADGNGLRQLTSDVARDRNPSWSPDGKTITFASNRTSDSYQIWTIRADGSGLQQITLNQSNAFWPTWSPAGARLAANTNTRSLFFLDASKRWSDQTVEFVASPAGGFRPRSWSRDGRWIIGTAENNDLGGLLNYSIKSRSFERLRDSGQSPRWLSDGRRIVFADGGRLVLLDVSTKRVRELLSLKDAVIRNVALAPDDHAIYFIPMITDGDIWMATLR